MSSCKVYLCCSIRGGRSSLVAYDKLVELINQHAKVINPFVTDESAKEESIQLSDREIHDRDMRLVNECDVMIAEVTQPSFGVGYEVGRAVELKKPVLCVHVKEDKRVSAMIGWASDEAPSSMTQLKSYTNEASLNAALKEYFSHAESPAKRVGGGDRKSSLDWKSYEPM